MELYFMITYNNKKFTKYITNDQIKIKILNIVKSLNKYYMSKDLVILCVLNGSVIVLSELLKSIKCDYKLDYIELSSYKGGTKSSGSIEIIQDIKVNLENKYVLIIEDLFVIGYGMDYNFKFRGLKDIYCLAED